MSRMSVLHLLVRAIVVLGSAGCALTGGDGIVGVYTPGAPARITLTTTDVAGGHAMVTTELIDSASASYALTTCTTSLKGTGDCEPSQRLVRPVSEWVLSALFAEVSSAEFRAVRGRYTRQGDFVRPDPKGVTFDVTVRERSRRVEWEDGAELPRIVGRLHCLVKLASGALISCAA